jgi:hypothetical protein
MDPCFSQKNRANKGDLHCPPKGNDFETVADLAELGDMLISSPFSPLKAETQT